MARAVVRAHAVDTRECALAHRACVCFDASVLGGMRDQAVSGREHAVAHVAWELIGQVWDIGFESPAAYSTWRARYICNDKGHLDKA